MNDNRQRSWFRFSLRSLLVVVTIVCIWLAWESSVVRTRKAALTAARTNPAFQFTTAQQWAAWQPPGSAGGAIPRVSLVRGWLGDQAIKEIACYRQMGTFTAAERERLARLFPEATFVEREIPLEPCHPGCFPRGTLVMTGLGRRRIETIQVGDSLTAMLISGKLVAVNVQSIFVTENRLWKVRTQAGELITTDTQPLCLAADEFRAAGELAPGDKILRLVDGEAVATTVLEVTRTERIEQVINLVLGDREAFVVGDGYLARSKPPAVVATK